LLLETGDGGYERRDYTTASWEMLNKDGCPFADGYITSWKGTVPEKIEKEDLFKNRDEKAAQLLKESLSDDREEKRENAFILSLYLARKRLLVLRKEIQDPKQQSVVIYEDPATEEIYPVPKLTLSSLDIPAIQKRLASLLR